MPFCNMVQKLYGLNCEGKTRLKVEISYNAKSRMVDTISASKIIR